MNVCSTGLFSWAIMESHVNWIQSSSTLQIRLMFTRDLAGLMEGSVRFATYCRVTFRVDPVKIWPTYARQNWAIHGCGIFGGILGGMFGGILGGIFSVIWEKLASATSGTLSSSRTRVLTRYPLINNESLGKRVYASVLWLLIWVLLSPK